jgi:uncharacterized protein (DUF2252 family)
MSDKVEPQVTVDRSEKRKRGKALRKQVPRSSHGAWSPASDRPDPIAQLQAEDKSRLQHLVPIKYGRMLASPFAFLRGSAAVMASDLTSTPTTGLETQLCGDAHLANFGLFASRERNLVFDVNDFDETYPGPWEWDLKRLAASAVVAGRENGFSDKNCRQMALIVARSYHQAMARLAQSHSMDVWYFYHDLSRVQAIFEKYSTKKGRKQVQKMGNKARVHTQEQSLAKLTRIEDGRRRINSDPPLLVPFDEIQHDRIGRDAVRDKLSPEAVEATFEEYLASLSNDRQHLLARFRPVDAALRVGGVGSVGTRCLIVLLQGDTLDEALILQLKEAGPSVLEPYLAKHDYAGPAQRVVHGQRLMQATSDIFLGWGHGQVTGLNYYWRQLKDMKGSINVMALDQKSFATYVAVCGTCLARAHARVGDAAGMSGYMGTNETLDQAIADFAVAYAGQTERDYQALVAAEMSGRITAETGI